jgi:hypothetical protein
MELLMMLQAVQAVQEAVEADLLLLQMLEGLALQVKVIMVAHLVHQVQTIIDHQVVVAELEQLVETEIQEHQLQVQVVLELHLAFQALL